jgi:hypothetical protein
LPDPALKVVLGFDRAARKNSEVASGHDFRPTARVALSSTPSGARVRRRQFLACDQRVASSYMVLKSERIRI